MNNNEAVSQTERGLILQFLTETLPELFILYKNSYTEKKEIYRLDSQVYAVREGSLIFKDIPLYPQNTVVVEFYFQKRGMYFSSSFRRIKNVHGVSACSIHIPNNIYKKNEAKTAGEKELSARLDFAQISLVCYAERTLSLTMRDLRLSHALSQLPICRFFTCDSDHAVETDTALSAGGGVRSLQNNIQSARIYLCTDSSFAVIVHGLSVCDDVFQRAVRSALEADIEITFSFGMRTITVQSRLISYLQRAVNGGLEAMCLYFSFTQIKQEDRRFLYERYYGSVFEG